MANEAADSSVAIATESTASIPVIDFAPFLSEDISTRQKIAHMPGTVVVNTVDLMERWTNSIFRSTKHRVVVPIC